MGMWPVEVASRMRNSISMWTVVVVCSFWWNLLSYTYPFCVVYFMYFKWNNFTLLTNICYRLSENLWNIKQRIMWVDSTGTSIYCKVNLMVKLLGVLFNHFHCRQFLFLPFLVKETSCLHFLSHPKDILILLGG